jgi:hypothetical protein
MISLQALVAAAAGFFGLPPDASHLSVLNNVSPPEPPRGGRRARRARKRGRFFTPCLEGLEQRLVPATNTWKDGIQGTNLNDWGTPTNWSLGHVPLNTEDVVISQTPGRNNPLISVPEVANSVTIQNAGNLTVNKGTLDVGTAISIDTNSQLEVSQTVTANTVTNSGSLMMYAANGTTLKATVSNLSSGVLQTDSRNESIVGNVSNAGILSIGGENTAPGPLNVTGDFTQTDTGTLQLYGSGNFTYSTLNVSGTAKPYGTLATVSDGSTNPSRTLTPTIITAGFVTGSFQNRSVPWGDYTWIVFYPAAATSVQLYVPLGTVGTSGSAYEQVAGQAPGEWEWLFTSADGSAPGLTIDDYEFDLAWGDGSVSTSTAAGSSSDIMIVQVPNATNEYQIFGKHTYANAGLYTVTATVTDNHSSVSWQNAQQGILVDPPPQRPQAFRPQVESRGQVAAAPALPGLAPAAATVPAVNAAAVDAALVATAADLHLWPADAGLRARPLDAYFAGLAG